MKKEDKQRVVNELTERLKSSETLLVADYRGLTMPQIDALRGRLVEQGARFTVVKNTLTRRAAEAAGADALLALLEGPTAIAFVESGGDPVAVAKALNEAARTTLMTQILPAPAFVRTTSKQVFSSAGAAPSPPAGAAPGAATATGAAAVTPHSSSSVFFSSTSSSTVILPSCSTSFAVSVAI